MNFLLPGILADSMGLGKTIQMLSFIASLHWTKAMSATKEDNRTYRKRRRNAAFADISTSTASSSQYTTSPAYLSTFPSPTTASSPLLPHSPLSGAERLPFLVLCPATVLQQWKEECLQWYPHLHPTIVHPTMSNFTGLGSCIIQYL